MLRRMRDPTMMPAITGHLCDRSIVLSGDGARIRMARDILAIRLLHTPIPTRKGFGRRRYLRADVADVPCEEDPSEADGGHSDRHANPRRVKIATAKSIDHRIWQTSRFTNFLLFCPPLTEMGLITGPESGTRFLRRKRRRL